MTLPPQLAELVEDFSEVGTKDRLQLLLELSQELPLPRHFAQLSELVSEDMISAPCGPSADDHIKGIRAYVDAGFDEVYIGQVGSEHAGFFEFYAGQVLPRLREA